MARIKLELLLRTIMLRLMTMPLKILDYQSTTAAWRDVPEMRDALIKGRSGLRMNDLEGSMVNTWIGRVPDVDASGMGRWASRNNALARHCLEMGTIKDSVASAVRQFGRCRVGLILGSSTSSIDRTEEAYRNLDASGCLTGDFRSDVVHNPGALSLFVSEHLGIYGPKLLINTACSSSAKVFAAAARWILADVVDAVLVGGCDALGLSVVHGFDALQLVSEARCRPLDAERDGINIGEAAGFTLLVKDVADSDDAGLSLVGYGESSDAHHMSHPHPHGLGAQLAMEAALAVAGIEPAAVDYINLHGTSSRANDVIEAKVIETLFPSTTLCSSTKAWTGHTLGAAGIIEAIIALDALETGLMPANMNLCTLDPQIKISVLHDNVVRPLNFTMSNSFGFGGNNCSLIFGGVPTSAQAGART